MPSDFGLFGSEYVYIESKKDDGIKIISSGENKASLILPSHELFDCLTDIESWCTWRHKKTPEIRNN